jgi:hypothetical protein
VSRAQQRGRAGTEGKQQSEKGKERLARAGTLTGGDAIGQRHDETVKVVG